jgi:hypothetical protein
MTAFIKDLPKPVEHFTDFYGDSSVADRDLLLVLHYAVMAPGPALGLASYCHSNPFGYRWHESIGSDGSCYRCGKIGQIGAHDMGINSKSYGIETTANSGTEMRRYPKLMNQLARRAATFAIDTSRKPSRDFIIGHYEDAKFGGTSTHVDTTPGWDWGEFMDLTNQHYDDLTGGDDVAAISQSTIDMLDGERMAQNDFLAELDDPTRPKNQNRDAAVKQGKHARDGYDSEYSKLVSANAKRH